MSLSDADASTLLETVRQAVEHGLEHGREPTLRGDLYPPSLRVVRATFVTFHLRGDLRGCVGTTKAQRPLVCDAAHSGYQAAFGDRRFAPLSRRELPELETHISILSPLEAVAACDEADLVDRLRPGIDGILLEDGERRGTFLPAMWEQLPDPREFLRLLKVKAGLPLGHWPPALRVYRYTVESIPRH